MTYKQMKALKQYCEYLEILTLEDLQIVKNYGGCTDNKQLLNYLYHETLIKIGD